MKHAILPALLGLALCMGCKENKKQPDRTSGEAAPLEVETSPDLTIIPIEHASAVVEWGDLTLYIDPVGGLAAFEGQKKPDLILITDIHWDHFSLETLAELDTQGSTIVLPRAAAEQIPQGSGYSLETMDNGDQREFAGISVEAIPMYNLREEALKFHEKGRGNGYVLTFGDQRVYFSGDTEDIPEMRALENIDKAFVCMNLPYTMTVESAADAVIEFKPVEVYPYHYRGDPQVSDVAKFKELVQGGDPDIKVIQWDWYPKDEF